MIAGASSQRLLLSRLLWVLSCSATRKCPAGGTAQEHGKVFVLGNFLWFSCEGREGALHHETGHVKAAISPLRFATVEMTLFYLNTNLPFRTDDCPAQFRAAPVLTVSPSEPKRIGSGPCPPNSNLSLRSSDRRIAFYQAETAPFPDHGPGRGQIICVENHRISFSRKP